MSSRTATGHECKHCAESRAVLSPSAYPRDLGPSLRHQPGLRVDKVFVAIERRDQVCLSMRIEVPAHLWETRFAARCEAAHHRHFVADQLS